MNHVVSVIVGTRNRARSLQASLATILSLQSPCRWELLVVDNGSTDSTRETVEGLAAGSRIPVRYLFEPLPGLSRALNRGIANATGDILLFIDDDSYPEPDFIAKSLEVLGQPGIDFFGGRVLLHDPTDAPVTIKTSMEQERIPPRSFVYPGTIHGCNMGFHRHVMDAIGGFNELLGPGSFVGSGNDVEFLGRASAAGFQGGYFPGPTVRHHHGRKESAVVALAWRYHQGRGGYYMSMVVNSPSKRQFLRGWLGGMSWRHPRVLVGELIGGFRYAMGHAAVRMRGKLPVPRMPRPQPP